MNKTKKLVSIIIPTYNRADFLSYAISGVFSQTYKEWELIIIDDGSIDNTKEIIDDFIRKDPRIKYFYKDNGGQGSARNLGIKSANGDFIAFLDSDDEWLPEKLEREINLLEKDSNFDFILTGDLVKDGEVERKKLYSMTQSELEYCRLAGIGVGVPSSHVYKKEAFDKVGFFDERRELIGLEDNEWSIRGYYLKGLFLQEALTVYQIHAGQITKENIKKNIRRQISGLEYILHKDFKIISKNKKALLFRFMQIVYLKIKYALRLYK